MQESKSQLGGENIDFDSITFDQLVAVLCNLPPEHFAELAEAYGLGPNQSANADTIEKIISQAYETVVGREEERMSQIYETAVDREAERLLQAYKADLYVDMKDHFRTTHLLGLRQLIKIYQKIITPTNIANATLMACSQVLIGIQDQMPAMIQTGIKGAVIATITIGASMLTSRHFIKEIDSF